MIQDLFWHFKGSQQAIWNYMLLFSGCGYKGSVQCFTRFYDRYSNCDINTNIIEALGSPGIVTKALCWALYWGPTIFNRSQQQMSRLTGLWKHWRTLPLCPACKTFFNKGEVRILCVATSIWISTKVVISQVHIFVLVRCWKRPLLAISARYGHTGRSTVIQVLFKIQGFVFIWCEM